MWVTGLAPQGGPYASGRGWIPAQGRNDASRRQGLSKSICSNRASTESSCSNSWTGFSHQARGGLSLAVNTTETKEDENRGESPNRGPTPYQVRGGPYASGRGWIPAQGRNDASRRQGLSKVHLQQSGEHRKQLLKQLDWLLSPSPRRTQPGSEHNFGKALSRRLPAIFMPPSHPGRLTSVVPRGVPIGGFLGVSHMSRPLSVALSSHLLGSST